MEGGNEESVKAPSRRAGNSAVCTCNASHLQSCRTRVLFWLKNYPLLSTLAIDTLIILASSAPIERIFAGDATVGKHHWLTSTFLVLGGSEFLCLLVLVLPEMSRCSYNGVHECCACVLA